MKKARIYLDFAATTFVDDRVLTAMEPYWQEKFGNTMSLHKWGEETDRAVAKARKIIAEYIGAKTEEIIFTGSATESNNLAIKGIAWANGERGKHIIVSAIEHDCVMESADWLGKNGWKISKVGVDKEGRVKVEELKKMIGKETVLVSVMQGNNETGVIQDIETIAEICKEKEVFFHTDAAQTLGRERVEVDKMGIALLTASSHKIYGPKGAAILYVKRGLKIEPWMHGGGQEGGLRSSTVNVAAIVGMGKAIELMQKWGRKENEEIRKLRDYLQAEIVSRFEGVMVNGAGAKRLPGILNVSFAGIEGEGLVLKLDEDGIAVSTGSACSSKNLAPSHVLLAMGRTAVEAHGSIRISLGRLTTKGAIDYFLEKLEKRVKELRKISPFKI